MQHERKDINEPQNINYDNAKQQMHVCFSPYCPNPSNRYFFQGLALGIRSQQPSSPGGNTSKQLNKLANNTPRQAEKETTINQINNRNQLLEKSPLGHQNCRKWVAPASLFTQAQHSETQVDLSGVDFLQRPIQSVISTYKCGNSYSWKHAILDVYTRIKQQIEVFLDKQYRQTIRKVCSTILQSEKTFNFMQSCSRASSLEQITKCTNILNDQESLRSLQMIDKIGKLVFINSQSINAHVNRICNKIEQIKSYFWEHQEISSVKHRESYLAKIKEINNYLQMPSQPINSKIQSIYSAFGDNFVFSTPVENSAQASCCQCRGVITGNGSSVRERRGNCQQRLLSHLNQMHSSQVMEKMVAKQFRFNPNKLTFSRFIRDLQETTINNFLVIDRQNKNIDDRKTYSPDLYVLDVISKNAEFTNIAKGRYLVAQSFGKDSADILIIVVLYQICKIPGARVTLLTNDHYGKTLEPIFKSIGFDLKIELGSYSNKTPAKYIQIE